jgi:cysteine desulfurase
MEKSKIIYLDNASATPIDLSVLSLMNKISKGYFANSSSIHDLGLDSKKKLEEIRSEVAGMLYALPDEIIFTSGATESNNLAVVGVLERYLNLLSFKIPDPMLKKGGNNIKLKNSLLKPHIITTNIEHSSVLEVCKYLERTNKAEVTYVSVEENGVVNPRKIREAIKSNTILISVMYANNEIGTVQPIKEIIKEIKHFKKHFAKSRSHQFGGNTRFERYPIFHTDATQAINYLPINILKLGVDMLSFNSAKIYGPKGVGVLFKKRNIQMDSIAKGGEQEFNLRPGTENIPLIAGLGEALKITEKIKEKETERLLKLNNYFIKKIMSKTFSIFDIKINGDLKFRLPNNINISIPKIPSDLLVIELSARGIYISEKSACKSGDKKGSYVIEAITGKEVGSLRFSFGRETTKKDIDFVINSLKDILKKLKKWYD